MPTTISDVDNRARTIGDELDNTRINLLERASEEATPENPDRSWIEPRAAKFAAFLTEFVGIIDSIRALDKEWRIQVLRGDLEFSEAHNLATRSLYVIWVLLADNLKERSHFFVRHGVDIATTLERLSQLRQEIAEVLQTWRVPVKSTLPGLRFRKLSPEAAQRLKELFPDTF